MPNTQITENRQVTEIAHGGLRVVVRKIATLIKISIKLPIGGIVVFLCYLLYPIVKIRFGHLYTSRIGHLCMNMDNYLALRKMRSSMEWGIFRTDKRIANKLILSSWAQQQKVLFTNFAVAPHYFLSKLMPNSHLLISLENELYDQDYALSKTPRIFQISKSDESAGAATLESLGIDRQFICFHNRDSAYLDQYGSDSNYHDYRDFEFQDFELAIERVTKSGTMAIRLGEIIKTESDIENPLFLSLTGSNRSNLLDVYLISQCLFFVGGNTGFSSVSRVLRKPQLLINYIPFVISGKFGWRGWSAGSLVIPKKILKISEDRYLRFSEISALPYDIHYQGNYFFDNGLVVVNNTQGEIADAIVEMQARVTGKWTDTAEQQKIQDQFWTSVSKKKKHMNTLRDNLGITVSSRFLERNQHLF